MSTSTLARRRSGRVTRPAPVPTAGRSRPAALRPAPVPSSGRTTGGRSPRVRPRRDDAGTSTAGYAVDRVAGGRSGRLRRLLRADDGMSTVEYAIGCIAAAAFAAALYAVVSGESVVTALTQLVQRALTAGF